MSIRAIFKSFVGLVLLCLITAATTVPDSGIKRTRLQTIDVPAAGPQECIAGRAELPPGASIGRHSHHGIEVGFVLKGSLELDVEGEGVRVLKQGDTYKIGAGKVHDARNVGTSAVSVNAVWVVEKGRPLSEPAA